MPYQAPGVYSQFVNAAAIANNPGASRILALIGTGVQTYTVYNEPVLRNANSSADVLQNSNVYQIIAVSSKPYGTNGTQLGNNIFFSSVGTSADNEIPEYSLNQGAFITWSPATSGTISNPQPGPTYGALQWTNAQTTVTVNGSEITVLDIQAVPDASDPNIQVNNLNVNESFMLQNGTYTIEITYVDPTAGSYRVIDMSSNTILGEYVCGSTPVNEAIPGVALTIQSTFVANPSDPTNTTSLTQVGDYVTITTTAATTYGTPAQPFTVNADGSLTLGNGTSYKQPKSPNNNNVYYVSYKYRKPTAAFEPSIFFSYYQITSEYGAYSVTPAGKVINSLSLGAEIAFNNGASTVVCVQAASENDADINSAIDLLTNQYPGIDTVNAVVPLTGFWNTYNVAAHLSDHVTEMSSSLYSKERMGYVANISAADTVANIVTNVSAYQNDRLVYIVPASVTKNIQNPVTNAYAIYTLPASYAAVAIAALAVSQDPAEPLTNKQISGFNDLGALYTESEMNMMAAAGALVLKENNGVIRIRHGITTATSDINSSEITVVQIRDYVIQAVRQTLSNTYIGHKLMPTLVADVKSSLQNILNQFIAQQVILSFNIVSVARSTLNPTEIDVSFQIEAVYPLNYIMIQFGFSSTITG